MSIMEDEEMFESVIFFLSKMCQRCIPLAFSMTVAETEVLVTMIQKDTNRTNWEKIGKQTVRLIDTLRAEVAQSTSISKYNQHKFEVLLGFLLTLSQKARYHFTPTREMAKVKLYNQLERMMKECSIKEPDMKSILSIMDMFVITYEMMKPLWIDLTRINLKVPKKEKIDVEAYFSISYDFYKRFRMADTRAMRNAFAHNDFQYDELNKIISINFSYETGKKKKGRKERKYEKDYHIPVLEFVKTMFEYTMLMFVMKIVLFLTYSLFFLGYMYQEESPQK